MSKWMVAAKKADFYAIAQQYHISPVMARIIRNRDVIEEADIHKFLHGTRQDLYAPNLMKDMDFHLHTIRATDEKTLERVIQGLKDKGFLLLEDN